jgi:hypothetical protein
MHPVDLIDAASELAPRRWKRYAATAFMAAFLLVPNRAADALTWYANEKADRIVKAVLDSYVPSSASSPAGTATTPNHAAEKLATQPASDPASEGGEAASSAAQLRTQIRESR